MAFTKALVGGKVLSFPHAPPQTDYDKPNKPGWVKKPRPDADPLYSSVYFYWWAFLRLNEDYIRCCEVGGGGAHRRLYEDFGDVRDGVRPTDDGDEFKAWWIERGAILFAEPDVALPVEEVREIKEHDLNGNFLFVKIPLLGKPKTLAGDVERLIKQKFAHRTGVFSQAMYKAAGDHQLYSLDCMLRIKHAELDLIKKYPNSRFTKARLVQHAKLPMIEEPTAKGADPKANIRKSGSRYLKDANTLIANVVHGSFPDFDEPNRPLSARPWLPREDDPHVVQCRSRLHWINRQYERERRKAPSVTEEE